MENQELKNEIDKLNRVDNQKRILNHPIIQALLGGLGVIPIIGSATGAGIDSGINVYLKKEEEKRLFHICEMIISEGSITTDMVKGVKEVISFAKMLDVARKLITNDKLDFLVRLYKNLVTQDEKDYSEYEEYLRRLDELSFREIEILHILDEQDLVIEDLKGSCQNQDGIFDMEAHHTKVQQIESKWLEFQEIVQQKFEIDPLDLQGYMQSISRSGFCVQYKVTDMPIRANGIFAVTRYYRNFANKIYK